MAMNEKLTALDVMRDAPVIPVIVLNDVKDAVPLARALVAGGIRMLEVTLRTPQALQCIEAIAKDVPEAVAGAGTIRSAADAQASALAGAKFGVSPGYTRAVGKACHDLGLPLLPGVATGSEIMMAQEDGYTQLKFFPRCRPAACRCSRPGKAVRRRHLLPDGRHPRGQRGRVPRAVERGLRGRFVDRADRRHPARATGRASSNWHATPANWRAEHRHAAQISTASDLKVIAFDVFGTVVDWHGGIAAEAERALPGVDGAAFALAWRAGYQPAMKAVMERIAAGEGGFTLLDELHLSMLEQVLHDFSLADRLDTAAKRDLNRAWHRLPAWPDSVAGLTRLKTKYTICTLSNGNIGLLTEMAKRAGLPWDCVLSAEVFKAYKPDPRTYLGVAGRVRCDARAGDAGRRAPRRPGRGAHLRPDAPRYIERPHEVRPRQAEGCVAAGRQQRCMRATSNALADLLGC